MTNTLKNNTAAVEKKFINAMGSGRGLMEYMRDLSVSVADSRDTTVFLRIWQSAHNRGDVQVCSAIVLVVRNLFPGVKASFVSGKDKKGQVRKPSIKIADCKANPDVLKALNTAVDAKLSLRGPAWRQLVEPKSDERAEVTREVADKMVAAQIKSKSLDRGELLALAAAYQAAAKKMLEAEKTAVAA